METRDIKILFPLDIRNPKIAYCKNLNFPQGRFQVVFKPLSTKMAWETDKEVPLNKQNTHSRYIFHAFLKKQDVLLENSTRDM